MIKQLMAALTSVVFAAPALPQELPPPYLLQSLVADCKSDGTIETVSCQTYIRGVFDLMLINSFVLKNIDANRTRLLLGEYAVCPASAVTIGAMKQGLINWAQRHPEEWTKPAQFGVSRALSEMWSCAGKIL